MPDGIPFRSDGDWTARKHGAMRRREGRKLHLQMNTATGDIRAAEVPSRGQDDSPFAGKRIRRIVSRSFSLRGRLSQIPRGEEIDTVTADGGYAVAMRPSPRVMQNRPERSSGSRTGSRSAYKAKASL
ncbi:hypothetical protein B5V46_05985 [Rhodovulum sp. MB263]|nr:hypothetical protein B5V46_05985 [Rhodovulum sp. MB263]